jgi:hypothetical protein
LKNALAYYNAGIVAANSKVVGLAPGALYNWTVVNVFSNKFENIRVTFGFEFCLQVGTVMFQGGGTFGTFMAIGTGIRCWSWRHERACCDVMQRTDLIKFYQCEPGKKLQVSCIHTIFLPTTLPKMICKLCFCIVEVISSWNKMQLAWPMDSLLLRNSLVIG